MMNEKMFLLLKDFRLATRRKAMLDLPMAEKLADLLALPSTKPIQQNLPESLAGPEQPLAPEIEVHLMPSLNAIGMQVALRVACDATEEAPVQAVSHKSCESRHRQVAFNWFAIWWLK